MKPARPEEPAPLGPGPPRASEGDRAQDQCQGRNHSQGQGQRDKKGQEESQSGHEKNHRRQATKD